MAYLDNFMEAMYHVCLARALLVKAARARGTASGGEQQELERVLDEASPAILRARAGAPATESA